MKTDFEIEQENRERFDEMLDECYPEIKIGTLIYSPSHVLKSVDPIAYEIGLQEFLYFEEEN